MQFSQFRHVGDIGHGRRYLGPAARSDEVEVEVQHTQGRERAQPLGTFRREHDAIAAQVEARQPRHVGDPLWHGSQPVIGDGKVAQAREAAQEITGVINSPMPSMTNEPMWLKSPTSAGRSPIPQLDTSSLWPMKWPSWA